MSCAFKGCSHCRRFNQNEYSFHVFPQDGPLLDQWLAVLGKDRNSWTWSKNKYVCSAHFLPEDYVIGNDKRCLKRDAVPRLIEDESNNVDPLSLPITFVHYSQADSQNSDLVFNVTNAVDPLNLSNWSNERLDQFKTESDSAEESNESLDSPEFQDIGGCSNMTNLIKVIHNNCQNSEKLQTTVVDLAVKVESYKKKIIIANKSVQKLKKHIAMLKMLKSKLETDGPECDKT